MAAIFLNSIEMLFSVIPMLILFGIFLIGYTIAWKDFKPKEISTNEEFELSSQTQYEPVTKSRELTDRELGIDKIGDFGALPAVDQRRVKMQKMILDFSVQRPEETAEVIKGWLSEN